MTDQPKEWRDEQGRFFRREAFSVHFKFRAGDDTWDQLTEGDARFLLKVLPEALDLERPSLLDEVLGPLQDEPTDLLPVSPETITAIFRSEEDEERDEAAMARRLELDAAIVEAAERLADWQNGDGGAYHRASIDLFRAVEAKRSALKPTGG